MLDANGSRFALLLGRADWGRCRLEAAGQPLLGTLWDTEATRAGVPLAYDDERHTVALASRVGRFRAGRGDLPADAARRLGAASDRHGNVYAIVESGRRIEVRSIGSGRVSTFWPVEVPAAPPVTDGAFAPPEPAAPPPPLALQGLAVTAEQYLVAGVVPAPGAPGGLLVFDLLAGGPPLTLAWPAPWRLVPQDMAARGCGGLVVLDRENRRVWRLDRRLAMAASFPVAPGAASDFAPPEGSEAPAGPAPPPRQPWFALAAPTVLGGGDPIAIEVLDDGALLVLDGAGSDGFALVSLYTGDGTLAAQASAVVARNIIAAPDQAGFNFAGFDFALHARRFKGHPRIVIVPPEGNQAIAFDFVRGPHSLVLVPDADGYLPLKRYRGANLVRGPASSVAADTGLLYESLGTWLTLVEQRRPRHVLRAALTTPPFDGSDPGCVWHRVMLDGCIPAGCRVRVAARATDQRALLADLPFDDEPLPALRPDGSELPWLIEGPGARTDAAEGHGTWELLLQRARGRWLQLRLEFEGNELATPLIAALRVWRARFSYAERYLPAVYREERGAADFLERFLANFEGQFTAMEDRVAAAGALFDVRSAPAETLEWLAGWLALALDPALDEARRRQLIRHAVPLFKYRGTTQALRLSVQLALSPCVSEAEFALPAPSQQQPYGVRIVERYLLRRLPPALLGETRFDDRPRQVQRGVLWTPAEGAEGLHARWVEWLARHRPDAPAAPWRPLPANDDEHSTWAAFCEATLGAVPALAGRFAAAWSAFAAAQPAAAQLGAEPPASWPAGNDPVAIAQRDAWSAFLDQLEPALKRWVRRWQGFVTRRHARVADHRRATGSTWPEFALLPVPLALPDNPAALEDWALFEMLLEPMAASAHAFSVLLPTSGREADAAALARQVDLARRVLTLAKPAHTRFDVRPYWALFRIGQVRLGLDTLVGLGVREPGIAPQAVLGDGQLGAARVAPAPRRPADRIALEC